MSYLSYDEITQTSALPAINTTISSLEDFYKSLVELGYKPIFKIIKDVGPTINLSIWMTAHFFMKIELHYANDTISPVCIIGSNIKIELFNFNKNAILAILEIQNQFKFGNKPYVSIIVTGNRVEQCKYCDVHPDDFTDYRPIEFHITCQSRTMSLIMQKNNQNKLTLFKMNSKKELYVLNNLADHPVFDIYNIRDIATYPLKTKVDIHNDIKKIINLRCLSMNSNKEYEDQMTMLINIISSVVTNKDGKKVNINEIVMGNMYYLNIKFNEAIYYIVFKPKRTTLSMHINDHKFIINLNTLKLSEAYKLLYDLITVVNLKDKIQPEKPSGDKEYEAYKKKLSEDTFDEIYQESWFEYLLKPFKFGFFN